MLRPLPSLCLTVSRYVPEPTFVVVFLLFRRNWFGLFRTDSRFTNHKVSDLLSASNHCSPARRQGLVFRNNRSGWRSEKSHCPNETGASLSVHAGQGLKEAFLALRQAAGSAD